MKNRYLKIIYISNGVFVFAASLVGPIFALYLNSFHVEIFKISLASTIWLVSTAVFYALLSAYGDRLKSLSFFLVLGFLIRTFCWIGYIFATDIMHIYILQIFLGLGEAVGSTYFDVSVAEHLDEGKHVRDYSEWKLIQSLASAGAATVGGVIVELYGFSNLFLIMAILALVSTFIFVYGMGKSNTNV